MDSLLWVMAAGLIVLGLLGTVLPVLPGTILVLSGVFLGAWIDDFTRIGTPTLVVVTILAVLAWVLDYVAGLLGAKRAGASKLALLGAATGTVVGLFMGLVGVFFMPLVGAAVGEYLAQNDHTRAVNAYSTQTGNEFHGKVETRSTANWTSSERSDAGFCLFTLKCFAPSNRRIFSASILRSV